MKLPDYVAVAEVKRVCKEAGASRLDAAAGAEGYHRGGKKILRMVNTTRMPIDPEEFRAGLNVELEHGTRFKDANVTNNHPVLTGKIVLAHLKESLDYYKLLEVAELEGDLLKAVAKGDSAKTKKVYKKLAAAKIILSKAEAKRVGR